MLGKGHGGLCKVPAKGEKERLRGEGDESSFINFDWNKDNMYVPGKDEDKMFHMPMCAFL